MGQMNTRYLIDIRLMGPVKQQILTLSKELHETFHLGNTAIIPHISLAGPFSTDNEEQLLRDFTRICRNQAVVPRYAIGGYGYFSTSRVIFVKIIPDENLKQFRYQLAQTIASYCTVRSYDREGADEFTFHSTLAMKLDWLTFQRIRWHFRNQESVRFQHHPIRVTLLKNGRIACEYDFVQERMLTRSQAQGKATRMRDSAILKTWDDSYRE